MKLAKIINLKESNKILHQENQDLKAKLEKVKKQDVFFECVTDCISLTKGKLYKAECGSIKIKDDKGDTQSFEIGNNQRLAKDFDITILKLKE